MTSYNSNTKEYAKKVIVLIAFFLYTLIFLMALSLPTTFMISMLYGAGLVWILLHLEAKK